MNRVCDDIRQLSSGTISVLLKKAGMTNPTDYNYIDRVHLSLSMYVNSATKDNPAKFATWMVAWIAFCDEYDLTQFSSHLKGSTP